MSGKSAARLGDQSHAPADAHGCPACAHPVTGPAVSGSPDVNINGLPALRLGDSGVHASCCGANTWQTVQGSATVFVNHQPAVRLGDATQHCGGPGTLIEGSPNVFIGDAPGGGGIVIDGVPMGNNLSIGADAPTANSVTRAMERQTTASTAQSTASTATTDPPPEEPGLQPVPLIPIEAVAQALSEMIEAIKADGLGLGVLATAAVGAVTRGIGNKLPVTDALENALKHSRTPGEALGKVGMAQAKQRQGINTDPHYIDRYHGPDDLGRDNTGKLTEIEAKGTKGDSTAVASNKSKEKQSSAKKNKRRAKQMTKHKAAKIGITSNRQGGAYTQEEIDLWAEIELKKGNKRHLSTHTNTETGRVQVIERDIDGEMDHILDEFTIDNFDAIKQGIEEAFKP